MRVAFDGPLLGTQPTGSAVYVREILSAALTQRPELRLCSRHATLRRRADHAASAARIAQAVESRTTPLPGSVLTAAESYVRLPRERWLAGRFNAYHQFHLNGDPAVSSGKLVVTVHDVVATIWPGEEGTLHPRAGRLLGRAGVVCAVSEFTRQTVHEHFRVPLDLIAVVPDGVDMDVMSVERATEALPRVRTRHALPARYLLHVGGSTSRKNIARLLIAFDEVAATDPDLALVMVGPHGRPAGASALHAKDRVIHLGFVQPDDLPSIYAGAEALVFPSLHEGFGIPILEAFAVGTAVVTSNVTACPEVAGGAAILVDPYDSGAIACGVLDVLAEDASTKLSRRAAGLARAREYSWTAAAQAQLDVYDRIARE